MWVLACDFSAAETLIPIGIKASWNSYVEVMALSHDARTNAWG